MVPYGPIFGQDEAYHPQEPLQTPPGPPGPHKNPNWHLFFHKDKNVVFGHSTKTQFGIFFTCIFKKGILAFLLKLYFSDGTLETPWIPGT